jgi:hypothetical protein
MYPRGPLVPEATLIPCRAAERWRWAVMASFQSASGEGHQPGTTQVLSDARETLPFATGRQIHAPHHAFRGFVAAA